MRGGSTMKRHLTGLIAAPFTPMNADGSLNLTTIEKQAALLSEGGVKGAYVCGTTGEATSLTISERMEIAERWLAVAGRDLSVIVNVGHLCLMDCKGLAAHAQKIGAYAIAAMAPSFLKPDTVEDLALFCAEIAAAAPRLPFYYYHIPELTGVNFPVFDFLNEAAERIPTLTGVKFTHEDLMDYGRCLVVEGGKYDMLFGRDEILLSALALGARGAVGTTYNFAAPLYLRIIEAYRGGDMATAQKEQARAMEMVNVLRNFGVLPAGKAIMKMIGLDCGPLRSPLRTLTDEQSDRLHAHLEDIGFFTYCVHH